MIITDGLIEYRGEAKTAARENCQGAPFLVIALDVPDAEQANGIAERLSGIPIWVKVGLELFTAEGPSLVRQLRQKRLPLFLDLKFHDIPNTVFGAISSVCSLGVQMTTLHISGGDEMCRAAVAAREEARAKKSGQTGNASVYAVEGREGPLLLGITVLTSQSGDPAEITALVRERALVAKRCGLDGVVCSGHEAAMVKEACGKDFLCLCPGIRFADARQGANDDQARVCTPAQAVAAGADFLVMGRPIVKAEDPAAAARKACEDMRTAFYL